MSELAIFQKEEGEADLRFLPASVRSPFSRYTSLLPLLLDTMAFTPPPGWAYGYLEDYDV